MFTLFGAIACSGPSFEHASAEVLENDTANVVGEQGLAEAVDGQAGGSAGVMPVGQGSAGVSNPTSDSKLPMDAGAAGVNEPPPACQIGVVRPFYITPRGYAGPDRAETVTALVAAARAGWSGAGATLNVVPTVTIKSAFVPLWFNTNTQGHNVTDDTKWLQNALLVLKVNGWDLKADPNSVYAFFVEVGTADTALGNSGTGLHYIAFDQDDITALSAEPQPGGAISHELMQSFGGLELNADCSLFDALAAKPAVCDERYWPALEFSNAEFRELFCDADRFFFAETCQSSFPKRERLCQ